MSYIFAFADFPSRGAKIHKYFTNLFEFEPLNTRIEILKSYLAEDPSDSFLRYALALEFMALNENEQAYFQLEKLLNDEPSYLAAYYMAGKTAEAIGKNALSVSWYLKGIEVAREQKNQHTLNELSAALSQADNDEI